MDVSEIWKARPVKLTIGYMWLYPHDPPPLRDDAVHRPIANKIGLRNKPNNLSLG